MFKLWYFIICFLFVQTNIIEAQIISGYVINNNEEAIPYVNIGIVNSNIGAISDKSGLFKIDITDSQKDILKFSSIGYYSMSLNVSEIQKESLLKVVLSERKYAIKEVVVSPSNTIIIKFGSNKTHLGTWNISRLDRGIKLAQLYKNDETISIEKISVNIKSMEFDSVLFRLSVYDEKDSLPEDNINTKEIYFTAKQSGWIDNYLEHFKLRLNKDFYIVIEPIHGWKNSTPCYIGIISFPCKFRGQSLQRSASFANWDILEARIDIKVLALKY